jgi:tetratricopeptide (TPR) repeat protein
MSPPTAHEWYNVIVTKFSDQTTNVQPAPRAGGEQLSDLEALLARGREAFRAGRLAEAEQLAAAALNASAGHPAALYLMGMVRLTAGEANAAEWLERAASADPGFAPARLAYGMALWNTGRTEEGLAEVERAAALAPADAATAAHLGALYLQAGRSEQAYAACLRCVECAPDWSVAHRSLGVAAMMIGRTGEAIERFRRAVDLDPTDAEAATYLADTLQKADRMPEAAAEWERVNRLSPDDAQKQARLASALQGVERHADDAEARNALGVALHDRNDPDGAVAAFEAALRLDPGLAAAWTNLGTLLHKRGEDLKAARCLRRALAIEPGQLTSLRELGLIFLHRGRRVAAEELFRRTAELHPEDAHVQFHLGACLLARGRYAEAWPHWEMAEVFPSGNDRWMGEANPDGSLAVCSVWGYGDQIQFVRYLGMVKSRWQGRVTFYCYPRLFELFAASGLPAELVPWPIERPLVQAGFDAYAYLPGLPGLLGTVPETIPADVPYLSVPEERLARWRARIEEGPELKVGLVWAGAEAARSCRLEQLAPLANIPGVRFYSLQAGPAAQQLPEPPQGLEIVDLHEPDFAETAAILQQLDLLISVDTAPAHLAGALARPCWVALAYSPDWRWLLDREDSPWYPTVRLFRQPRFGAWEPVWTRVAEELRSMAESRGS